MQKVTHNKLDGKGEKSVEKKWARKTLIKNTKVALFI